MFDRKHKEHDDDDDEHDQHDRDDDDTNVILINVEDDHPDRNPWLEQIAIRQTNTILKYLQKVEHNIMVNLDALREAVSNQTTVGDSIVTLLDGIAQQLTDLLAAGTVDPVELQSLVDQINTTSGNMSAAVTEHTTVETPPVEAPPADAPPVEVPALPAQPV